MFIMIHCLFPLYVHMSVNMCWRIHKQCEKWDEDQEYFLVIWIISVIANAFQISFNVIWESWLLNKIFTLVKIHFYLLWCHKILIPFLHRISLHFDIQNIGVLCLEVINSAVTFSQGFV